MPEQADWDILSGVGLTALGAAAARAIASQEDNALVHDPYAVEFARAAAPRLPPDARLPLTLDEAKNDSFPWLTVAGYLGVRSKFFDEFCVSAATSGARQVVIVAAGLDTRAFRLQWPDDVTVFEVDAPMVLSFKDDILREAGAEVRCRDRRTVAADLRDDWAASLQETGFDPERPSAWIAEGLFMYLPDEAQESLLATADRLSAPGSRFAVEFSVDNETLRSEAAMREVANRIDMDPASIWMDGGHHSPASWLHEHGWHVDVTPVTAAAGSYGRALDVTGMEALGGSVLIAASRDR